MEHFVSAFVYNQSTLFDNILLLVNLPGAFRHNTLILWDERIVITFKFS